MITGYVIALVTQFLIRTCVPAVAWLVVYWGYRVSINRERGESDSLGLSCALPGSCAWPIAISGIAVASDRPAVVNVCFLFLAVVWSWLFGFSAKEAVVTGQIRRFTDSQRTALIWLAVILSLVVGCGNTIAVVAKLY